MKDLIINSKYNLRVSKPRLACKLKINAQFNGLTNWGQEASRSDKKRQEPTRSVKNRQEVIKSDKNSKKSDQNNKIVTEY